MRLSTAVFILVACALAGACAGAPDARVENRGADTEAWWHALPRADWARYPRVPVASDWFEVYRVADDVYAIYEPGQFEEVISFLIVGDARALLFDTGLGVGDIRSVVESITDRDIVVLNSHSHYDHVGGNHDFERVLGSDTAYTRANELGTPAGELAEYLGPGWVWKPLPNGTEAASFRTEPWQPDRRVADGDIIDLGGRSLEVLVTPGHAPDAICLIDRDSRLLYTGDTFYLAPLYTHLEGSDFDAYRQSVARLAALSGDVDYLMTSHNVPKVSSAYLAELDAAFAAIETGRAQYVVTDGLREYDFGDFSVIVAGNPAPD